MRIFVAICCLCLNHLCESRRLFLSLVRMHVVPAAPGRPAACQINLFELVSRVIVPPSLIPAAKKLMGQKISRLKKQSQIRFQRPRSLLLFDRSVSTLINCNGTWFAQESEQSNRNKAIVGPETWALVTLIASFFPHQKWGRGEAGNLVVRWNPKVQRR